MAGFRERSGDAEPLSLSSISTSELMALEHEGARAIWEATLSGVPWQQLVAEDGRQHELREELADRLADEPPRSIGERETEKARAIAALAHRTQTDKVGSPYLEHPVRVADRVQDDHETYVVGLLHDVIEDGPYHQAADTEFVCSMSAIARDVGPQIAVAVHRLTRSDSQPDHVYYARIRGNPLALTVKLADIADNTDPARMAQLDPGNRLRLGTKYAKALAILRAPLPISPQAEAFVAVASNDVDRDTFTVEWWSTVKSDPAHADKTLTVRHRADVITGIRWPNQKPDINGEIRPPSIGEWTHFPYIIASNGVEWVRLHTVYGTVIHQHYVDGEPVSKDAWNRFRPASLANRPEHFPGNTLTVRMDKIRIL